MLRQLKAAQATQVISGKPDRLGHGCSVGGLRAGSWQDLHVRHVNVFECLFEYDDDDPEGYRAGVVRAGAELDAQETAVKLYEIASGESICPYHYEYVEEWMLVLAGEVVVRTPEGEHAAPAGALARFPAGRSGAHKVTNRAEQPARVLMFSSSREPAVAVYPDSDKIGVWPGDEGDSVMLRRADGQVPYYDGER
jgi:uncharacterized cupin superfamily protein